MSEFPALVELHDPASASNSIRMFSMGSCVSRSQKSASDDKFPKMSDLSEFKAAIRVLRGAMAFVHWWNCSIDALENFLIQSNFGSSDLASVSKPAAFLSQFTDYVLVENASRWRDMETFSTTRDLRNTWAGYISQKADSLKQEGLTLPSLILSGPPGPLEGYLHLVLIISPSFCCIVLGYCIWCCSLLSGSLPGKIVPQLFFAFLRPFLKLDTVGAFFTCSGNSFHFSATL